MSGIKISKRIFVVVNTPLVDFAPLDAAVAVTTTESLTGVKPVGTVTATVIGWLAPNTKGPTLAGPVVAQALPV